MADIVTRFAPSPTGYLHIGGARTALFNWLFARGRGGRFLLRIEDTDRARSTPEAEAALLKGLTWLGLDWDGEVISQFSRLERHREVADEMLARGRAYKCFSTPEEIAAFREAAKAAGTSTLFRSPWRDVPEAEHPDAPFVVRIKAPRDGETVAEDQVQGRVRWSNTDLDDWICLRSDGTPTYLLAVVVDDHDMGVTHVIRGDDHLSNVPRQTLAYAAMDWDVPVWAHVPLIHGPDGKKLSKRHGAVGLQEYEALGYPASAMRNYLARLGWSHGDDEIFSDDQAKSWFGFDGMGKSPARLDFKKLENVSGHHIAQTEDAALLKELQSFLAATGAAPLSPSQQELLSRSLYSVKERAKTFPELLEKAKFALDARPLDRDEKSQAALDSSARDLLRDLTPQLQNASWSRETLEVVLNSAAEARGLKFGKLAQPLRAALAGRTVSPSVFDMMLVLGREETIARLSEAAND